MQVNFTFRHFEPSDAIKAFSRDRIEGIRKFLDTSGEANIVMSVEKHVHHAEILLRSGPFVVRGREKSDDMYASIGAAMDKVERQIKRYKDRMRRYKPAGHHSATPLKFRKTFIETTPIEESADEAVDTPPQTKVVDTKEVVALRMTVDEALLQMALDEHDFFVFTNAETGNVSVLYRRRGEGAFGLIDATTA